MKSMLALTGLAAMASATNDSGIKKVIELLSGMEGKINSELTNEEKLMDEYTKYCDDTAAQKGFSIETAVKEIEGSSADIESAAAKITESQSVVSESATDISEKEKDLSGATKVRGEEHGEFLGAEKELMNTVDMLGRAASVLKRELSFVQTKSQLKGKMGGLLDALAAITDAAFMPAGNKKALNAFLEQLDDDSSDDLAFVQQPQAKMVAYESKSGGIVETILNMQDKAEEQLSKLRKDEMVSKHEFEMLAQSLSDATANLKEQLASAKKANAAAAADKAEGEESKANAGKEKAADEAFLKKLQSGCQSKAKSWEARQVQAKEELAALAKAKEVLASGVKVMFAQVASTTKRVHAADLENSDAREKVVATLKKLSRSMNSFALVQLANHAKNDPFGKIKGLIEDMIAKLEKQAQEEATKKAYCDKEMSETKAKKDDLMSQVDSLSAKSDSKAARSAKLKSEAAELTKELNEMATAQAEMDKLRRDEKAQFSTEKSDLDSSIAAVQTALKVLSEYYGSSAFLQQPADGPAFSGTGETGAAAGGVIGMLEVAESDFTKSLAEAEATEAESAATYESTTQENKLAKATKDQDVKYKTKEANTLDKEVAELSSDEASVSKELDAVLAYDAKIKEQCIAKPEPYEERAKKRAAEIEGLKEALDVLETEAAGASLIQKKAFLSKIRAH